MTAAKTFLMTVIPGELPLQGFEGDTGLDDDGHVGDGVLDDFVEAEGGEGEGSWIFGEGGGHGGGTLEVDAGGVCGGLSGRPWPEPPPPG